MKIYLLVLLLIAASFDINAQNKNYYVSNSGNDKNDGLSIATAWKTISKVNATAFFPGDVIQFNGGDIFTGYLFISSNKSGATNSPITFKSFGQGRAIIDGGTGDGVWIYNAEYVQVRDLVIKGSGVDNNNGAGIYASSSLTDKMLYNVFIDNVDVSGFYWMGIGVATEGKTTKGFRNLRITNSAVYNNGISGIETSGSWDEVTGTSSFNHDSMYIGYTKVYNNHGISSFTSNWSGTGILMAGVQNGVIEYCEAFENGRNNGCTTGGPVGIWLANAKNCIIQYSESYNNKAGKSKDGGGFDIDGGSQNCIIQYCYSHENEGPGYALFEWGNNLPFTGNVIRYNISQNDARKNSYGALTFWATDASHKLVNCEVYNNSIYISNKNLVDGTPYAVKFMNQQMKGLKIRNNIFYTTEGTRMLYSGKSFDTTIAHFQNNNYFDTSGKPTFNFGYTYTSFSDWKKSTNGQEMHGSKSYGLTSNPEFINPGGGKTINPASGGNLSFLTAYMLSPGSGIIDKGINLKEEFGLHVGEFDFYQNRFADSTKFEVGANEFNASKFIVMPLRFLNFTAGYRNGFITTDWQATSDKSMASFALEVSFDGRDFSTLKNIKVQDSESTVRYREKVKFALAEIIYVRVKGITIENNIAYTNIVCLKNDEQKAVKLYPNPVNDQLYIDLKDASYQQLIIRNANSQVLLQSILDEAPIHVLNVKNLNPGFYSVELYNSRNNKRFQMSFIKN